MARQESGSNHGSSESKAYVRMALIQGALLAPSARALGEQSTLPLAGVWRNELPEHTLLDLEGSEKPGSMIRA